MNQWVAFHTLSAPVSSPTNERLSGPVHGHAWHTLTLSAICHIVAAMVCGSGHESRRKSGRRSRPGAGRGEGRVRAQVWVLIRAWVEARIQVGFERWFGHRSSWGSCLCVALNAGPGAGPGARHGAGPGRLGAGADLGARWIWARVRARFRAWVQALSRGSPTLYSGGQNQKGRTSGQIGYTTQVCNFFAVKSCNFFCGKCEYKKIVNLCNFFAVNTGTKKLSHHVIFFAVNMNTKKLSHRVSFFFAVNTSTVFSQLLQKKITRHDDFFLLNAFTAKKKNTRITKYTHPWGGVPCFPWLFVVEKQLSAEVTCAMLVQFCAEPDFTLYFLHTSHPLLLMSGWAPMQACGMLHHCHMLLCTSRRCVACGLNCTDFLVRVLPFVHIYAVVYVGTWRTACSVWCRIRASMC